MKKTLFILISFFLIYDVMAQTGYNTIMGSNVSTQGYFNCYYGYSAGSASQSVNACQGNVGIGGFALSSTTVGATNTAIGFGAMQLNTTGVSNVAIGYSTLINSTTGKYNVGVGQQALGGMTTGYYNTAVGYKAVQGASTASYNTGIGFQALYGTTGPNNTATGFAALQAVSAGTDNVANGYQSLLNNTGSFNTAMGSNSLYNNTTGAQNTAIGFNALNSMNTGTQNTATGYNALQGTSTGTGNTGFGYQAGITATIANANHTGSYNTFIGYNAGPGSTTQLTNATAIGANSIVTANNSIVLGGTGANAVNVGIGTATPTHTLEVIGIINASGILINGQAFAGGGSQWSTVGTNLLYNTTGNVGIGSSAPDSKLTVNGAVHATSVKVDLNVPGPDYVFEKDYKLKSLSEVNSFIDQNKHLPEIPSANEMEKNGVQLGEMNMLLLKKVEELTLYLIEVNKKMEAQQLEIDYLKKTKN